METTAKLNNAPLSAQKARLVGDQIRGLTVEKALNTLKFSSKNAAVIFTKILESAIANAEQKIRIALCTISLSYKTQWGYCFSNNRCESPAW